MNTPPARISRHWLQSLSDAELLELDRQFRKVLLVDDRFSHNRIHVKQRGRVMEALDARGLDRTW